jgi:hypothetical protein
VGHTRDTDSRVARFPAASTGLRHAGFAWPSKPQSPATLDLRARRAEGTGFQPAIRWCRTPVFEIRVAHIPSAPLGSIRASRTVR